MRSLVGAIGVAVVVSACSPGHRGVSVEASATRTAAPSTPGAHLVVLSGEGDPGRMSMSPEPAASLDLTELDTGVTRSAGSPLPAFQDRSPFLARGQSVVTVLDWQRGPYDPSIGTAYAVDSSARSATALGPASSVYPALEADRVWLATDNSTPDQRLQHNVIFGSKRTVAEVDVQGHAVTPVYALPDRRSVLAAADRGLLTERVEGPLPITSGPGPRPDPSLTRYHLEVWDPATGNVTRTLDSTDQAVMAAFGRYVAWRPGPQGPDGPVRLTDLTSGSERQIPPPAGMQWLQAAVSPDGSWLGLLAYQPDPSDAYNRPPGAPPPPGTRAVVVAVFDPASGVQESETQTQVWRGGTSLVWSPEATRLFFTQDATHVGYVGVHSPTVHAVGIPRTIDFVVLTSPASA